MLVMNVEGEDVVFEGSPLAQHLQNVGVEFEAVTKEKDDVRGEDHGAQNKMEDNIKMWKVGNSTIIGLYYRRHCMEIVLNSGLLIQEDFYLLSEFMEEVNGRSLTSNLKPMLKWGTLGALMAGIILSRWKSFLPTVRTALCSSFSAFAVWRWGSIWTAPILFWKMKSFLEVTKKVDDRIRKAVSIIVDFSLISRGYLLLQRDAASWKVEKPNLLELSRRSQANLPGLRNAVIAVCGRLSYSMTEATAEMRRKRPLPYNLDHDDLYLPNLEVDITLDVDSADRLPTVEKLRLAAKKHLILRSEYLRRWFLHLLFFETSPVDIMWNCKLEEQMRCCLEIIENALLAYKPYVCTLVKQRDVTPGRPKSYLDELATTSHSMSMHIQEALFSSQELENAVLKCKDISLLDVEFVDKLNHKIKHHLQCADMCMERSAIVCGKSVRKESPVTVPAISKSTTDKQEEQTGRVSEERVDIAPCDEVFELYSKGGEERYLGEGETIQAMDQGQQFLMLQELKNVLEVKAADWKERERTARRQRVGDLHDISSSESDPEDDISKVKSCTLSKRKVERKQFAEMKKEMLDEVASSYQNEGGEYSAWFPVMKEQGREMVGSPAVQQLAEEAVAKARAHLSVGLLSDVQSFGSSESEESLSG